MWIGILILKVSDVDVDLFFFSRAFRIFSHYVQTRLSAPYFFLKGEGVLGMPLN